MRNQGEILQVWGYCSYTFGFTRASDDKTIALTLSLYSSGAEEGSLHIINCFMSTMKKGRTKFTREEICEIRELILKKCNADSSSQKPLRNKLRKLGFHISDFVHEIKSVEDFDQLVEDGSIVCIYGNTAVRDKTETTTVAKYPFPAYRHTSSTNKEEVDENIKSGLNPIVGNEPKILILGTLPGDESIRKQQYYAKAGNRFWGTIYGLFKNEIIPTDYKDKTTFLKEHKIAVWDVLSGAVRDGSLDSNIQQDIPNDIPGFLKKYPSIEIIAFNGQKAKKIFDKYFPTLLADNRLRMFTLLSTSGANNQFSLEEMIINWNRILK